jgi:primosomal protein N' (replication factor Y) (superfamily II helicase)
VSHWTNVVVATPAHSGLGHALTYRSEQALAAGSLVRVPLGQREVLGVVWGPADAPATPELEKRTKGIICHLDGIQPLSTPWRALVEFAARYYQRSMGEVALAALPPQLREVDASQLAARQQRQANKQAKAAKAASALARKAAKTATATSVTSTTAMDSPASPGQATSDTSDAAAATSTSDATAHAAGVDDTIIATQLIAASAQQTGAIDQFFAQNAPGELPKPCLLFGATGSGKTEVYLRCTARVLQGNPTAQVLVMVPEINLTPQLHARFTQRFAPLYGAHAVVAMHSGMTPTQRLHSWMAAHHGTARIVLGTRMAVFASMPGLQLIVVDEEHDPSYKSQDGARHSARDLSVLRAKLESEHQHGAAASPAAGSPQPCRVLLGSATPSLESWHACTQGRYQRLDMPERVGGGAPARLRMVDMRQLPQKTLFAPALLDAIRQRIHRGEQCLIFLNRRGYAPVLACDACGWKSECPHCSAYRVFHKIDRTLRCHHCGTTDRVPRACPDCGNIDIAPLGRGTEKLEEQLAQALGIGLAGSQQHGALTAPPGHAATFTAHLEPTPLVHPEPALSAHPEPVEGFAPPSIHQPPDSPTSDHLEPVPGLAATPSATDAASNALTRPDGSPVVIARMDADTTRHKGALEQQLAQMHSGHVDILVGTQMVAKGHDFRRITLVAAVNADSALYSSDFRAPERLFSLLMQAAGRAGRDAALAGSEMWVQTYHPEHALFASLKAHDYPGFATQQLAERTQAGLPPMSYQALIRAEARSQEAAQAFLSAASEGAAQVSAFEHVTLYPSVPMSIQRIANIERAQMLVESSSRAALQKFLASWQPVLRETKVPGVIRWAMDVDPLAI